VKKLVSIFKSQEKEKTFHVVVDVGAFYSWFTAAGAGAVETRKIAKKEFKNYEHFVGVMSKFNPYTFFLKAPVQISTVTYAEVEQVYQRLKKDGVIN
jgi:hypothetical protein